jgi:hypothetical protein
MPRKKVWSARDSQRYNYDHQLARKRWALVVATGQVPCGRCGLKIAAGEPWHLDHLRPDFSVPSHRSCNCRTSAHRVAAMRVSREW